ncbi:DNA-binding response regulator [Saccharopolyspora shandongensis]|uniref:DNA-binding response regulator n=1 Tax=Saccharopolyspora shandongensis TaxID=418495 RepID=UPI00341DD9E4
MGDHQVIAVRGEADLIRRAGHLFTDARTEFVCAATDLRTWSHPRLRPTGEPAPDLRVRKLFTSAALCDPQQRQHLLRIADVGAEVRICAAPLPHETIIIDRRAMILAGATTAGEREFTATTAPTLVNGVHALFDATWHTAIPLADYLRQELPQIDQAGRSVLQALNAGLTDEAAARRIGVSLRTYRRRVAELMTLLDANSRFQAGARAGELGLTS